MIALALLFRPQRFKQHVMAPGIQPCKSPAMVCDAPLQVFIIHARDSIFRGRTALRFRNLNDIVVIEIQPRHGIIGLRAFRLSSMDSAFPSPSNSTTPYLDHAYKESEDR